MPTNIFSQTFIEARADEYVEFLRECAADVADETPAVPDGAEYEAWLAQVDRVESAESCANDDPEPKFFR